MTLGLTRIERFNLRAVEAWHRQPLCSAASVLGGRFVTRWLVEAMIGWLVRSEGFARLRDIPADRGILICSNHRSLFDNFAIAPRAMAHRPLLQRFVVPTRTETLYDRWWSLAVNAAVGALNIYPPIVRSARGAIWGQRVIAILTALLRDAHAVVLIHPEGRRNGNPDPLALLPARPGLGRVMYESGAVVVPVFLGGFPRTPAEVLRAAADRLRGLPPPAVALMGDPIDLSALRAQEASPALYRAISQHVLDAIGALGRDALALRRRPAAPTSNAA